MPNISPERIIVARPGDVFIFDVRGPVQSAEELASIADVQTQIGSHFMGTAELFQYARSGTHNDLEALRTELDPGFRTLLPEIDKAGLTDRDIINAVREAVKKDNVDPNEVDLVGRQMGRAYLDHLNAYRQSLPLQAAS